jgi:hypothetical protein
VCGTAASASVMGWIERCTGSQKASIPLASRPDTQLHSLVCVCLQGEAFSNVRHGMPGMAYFAGVSMSYAGTCTVYCTAPCQCCSPL